MVPERDRAEQTDMSKHAHRWRVHCKSETLPLQLYRYHQVLHLVLYMCQFLIIIINACAAGLQ